MNGRQTFFETKLATSFKIGELFVTANSLPHFLSTYTQPALFYAHALEKELEHYRLSMGGTAFKVKFRGRYFCLVSAHQIRSPNSLYDYDELCIHSGATKKLFTSHRAIFSENDEGLSFDAILYEFTDLVKDKQLTSYGWYPLSEKETNSINPKPLKCFSVDFPGHHNFIDYSKLHYSFQPYCAWGEEVESQIEGRLAFSTKPKLSFDPKGMSGSPVFGVEIDQLNPSVFFAGLLTNASREIFHFLPRKRLGLLFRYALDD